jgi:hypothetical protein
MRVRFVGSRESRFRSLDVASKICGVTDGFLKIGWRRLYAMSGDLWTVRQMLDGISRCCH